SRHTYSHTRTHSAARPRDVRAARELRNVRDQRAGREAAVGGGDVGTRIQDAHPRARLAVRMDPLVLVPPLDLCARPRPLRPPPPRAALFAVPSEPRTGSE